MEEEALLHAVGDTLEDKKRALLEYLRRRVTCECDRCGILIGNVGWVYCEPCGQKLKFHCPCLIGKPHEVLRADNRPRHWKETCPFVMCVLLQSINPALNEFTNNFQQ